jgi:cystathionine beta-synthase
VSDPDSHLLSSQQAISQAPTLASPHIHALVAGAGTGGTITGLSRALRDHEAGVYPLPEEEAERKVKRDVEEFDKEKKQVERRGSVDSGEESSGIDSVECDLSGMKVGGSMPDPPRGLVVAIDPIGSILSGSSSSDMIPYVIEGIGYDFIPDVLDPTSRCVDKWVKVGDEEAIKMVRIVM